MTSPALVDAAVLTAQLTGPGRVFGVIESVAAAGSTNADLAAAARAGAPSGRVLVADHQIAGRGRLARRWTAAPGESVAISVLLRPDGSAAPDSGLWSWLPLIAGLAVADALAALGVQAELKWPNDVLIAQRKVCGILAERVDGAAIIGIGINTAMPTEHLPVPTATSLLLAGVTAPATTVVAEVLSALERVYEQLVAGVDLRDAYTGRCSTIGQRVRVIESDSTSIEGLAVGVDVQGRLRVNTPVGERVFAAGDVRHLR